MENTLYYMFGTKGINGIGQGMCFSSLRQESERSDFLVACLHEELEESRSLSPQAGVSELLSE